MGLTTKLQLKQAQSLSLTPQLLQSIKLLQMTRPELEQFLTLEAEKNPFLEVPTFSQPTRSLTPRSGGSGEGFDFTQISDTKTLRQHAQEQAALTFSDKTLLSIAITLANNLDDDGYLRLDLTGFCKDNGIETRVLNHVLAACRQFDPPGIFARDLADCLSLQLEANKRLTPAFTILLLHLHLLAARNFEQLAKLCDVSQNHLASMVREIRKLDPKPGQAFAQENSISVTPEVVVLPTHDGGWIVELEETSIPRVLVDRSYAKRVMSDLNDNEKQFVSDALQNANWLIRSLDQRMRTILAVASEIVKQQHRFFDEGVQGLRPLSLKLVADAVGMHESTISRVTSQKYMMTPRGLFELRYFFTGSVSGADGNEARAAQSVRDQIRKLIEHETSTNVLSDDTLVELLRKQGVDIARRTVAKYREGLGIPSSVQRRREKRMAGL